MSRADAERVATQTHRDREAGATGGTPAPADRVPAPIATRRKRSGRQTEWRVASREVAARGGDARPRRSQIGTVDRSFIELYFACLGLLRLFSSNFGPLTSESLFFKERKALIRNLLNGIR